MNDRIKYLENEYNSYYKYLREVSSYLFDISYGTIEKVNEEDKKFAEYWTHEYLYRMYNILCVYFETLNLNDFLLNFKSTFEPIIINKEESTKISSILLKYGDTDEDFDLLIKWKKYLAPFNFFWDKRENKENIKLVEFLECTNEILKVTKTEVSIEEDINSIIREIAKFYFNGVMAYSEGYFVHQFKHYKPDVIIKELNTAIEYKLIREDKEIGIKLDELLIDSQRYSGNHNNKNCIAVFCLSDKVRKTKKEIKEEWNNMNFGNNWEIVIINDVHVESKKKNKKAIAQHDIGKNEGE